MPSLRGCRNASAFLDRTLAVRTGHRVTGTIRRGHPFCLGVTRCTIRTPFRASGHFLSHCASPGGGRRTGTFTALVRNVSGSLKSVVSRLRGLKVTRGALVFFLKSGNKSTPLKRRQKCNSSTPLEKGGNARFRNNVHIPFVID